MRKAKFIATSFIVLFFLSVNTGLVTVSIEPTTPEWKVPDRVKLVYNITKLVYISSEYDTMPIYDEDDYLGNLTEGNLFFAAFGSLPDPTAGYTTIEGEQYGADTNDHWPINYTIPLSGDSTWEQTSLFCPIIPVWSSDVDWGTVGANFTITDSDFSHMTSPTHFSVRYFNLTAPLGYIEINATWNKATGVLEHYLINTTEHGPEGEYMFVEMDFMYFRDESQWDVYYGINEGDMAGWNVTTASYGTGDSMELIHDEKTDKSYNLTEGDCMVIMFDEVWDPMDPQPEDGRGPTWNGTVMTPDWDRWVEFSYEQEGGPPLLFPLWVTGNDYFYGNMTDELESRGMDVTKTGDSFQVDWTGSDEEAGIVGTVVVEWSLDTGLLNYYHITVTVNGTPAELRLDFLYRFQALEARWKLPENAYVRYVAENIQNGTRNYLDFGDTGGGEPQPGFRIYDDDLISYHFNLNLYPIEYRQYSMNIRTSRGYETQGEVSIRPPGLEYGHGSEGLPAAWPVIPVGMDEENYYANATAAWSSLGYTIRNNDFEIGFDGYVAPGLHVDVTWNKSTGLLTDYYFSGEIEGNNYALHLVLGTVLLPEDMGYSWGFNIGDSLEYHFNAIDFNGEDRIEFGDEGGHYMYVDETITFTISDLSSFSTYNYEGPYVEMSIAATYHTQHQAYFTMAEPGFELAGFDGGGDGGLPLFYPVMPLFDGSWDLLADLYDEGGYTATIEGNEFRVVKNFDNGDHVDVRWDTTDGRLTFYNVAFTVEMEGETTQIALEIEEGPGSYIPPEPSGTAITFSPGFEFLFIFTAMIAAIVIRRKKA